MDAENLARLEAWEELLDDCTYYEILGVLEIADEGAIRQAFRQFCGAFHPDAHPGAEPAVEQRLKRLFQRAAEGYRVLLDPELRSQYDLAVAKGHTRWGVESHADPAGVKSLDDLCRSASGKMHARRADRLISGGELGAARAALLEAIRSEEEPDAGLEERLEALDVALFARGT